MWIVGCGARNVKFEMWSGKRELRVVERGVQSGVWSAECRLRSVGL